MHTHVALIAGGQNAFFDPDEPSQLSAVGRGFVAGILRHARELCLVFAQWVNSYKRLVPGFEAPVYVAWSERNRSAVVRVPPTGRGARTTRPGDRSCAAPIRPATPI